MTSSDKCETKCQFGQSELLMPAESAIKEFSSNDSCKAVHNAEEKLRSLKVRWWLSGRLGKWSLRCLSQSVGFCPFECGLKSSFPSGQ